MRCAVQDRWVVLVTFQHKYRKRRNGGVTSKGGEDGVKKGWGWDGEEKKDCSITVLPLTRSIPSQIIHKSGTQQP